MTASVSKINAFAQCKHKYKLAYIDKVTQEQFPFFEHGSRVHKALESISTGGVKADTTVSKFLESSTGKKYLGLILGAEKEVPFGIKIQNNEVVPCGFSDPDAFFHGVIDVLSGNTIIDYKTGRKKSFADQDWKQLMFYAVYVFLKHPEYSEVHLVYLYIEHDHENALTVKRTYLTSILKQLLVHVTAIVNFEKSPTDEHCCTTLCDYCGCRKHCSFYAEREAAKLENIVFETF